MSQDYQPSQAIKKEILGVYEDIQKMFGINDSKYSYFSTIRGDQTLKEFIDDNEKMFNQYVPPRDLKSMEDWQANMPPTIPRNKTLAIVSKLALKRPHMKVVDIGTTSLVDTSRSEVAEETLGYSNNRTKENKQYFFEILEGIVKGTIISYEGYKKEKNKIKEILSYDPATGEVKFNEKEVEVYNDCYSQIVPLQEFLIFNSHISAIDLQKQSKVAWVTVYKDKESFLSDWGGVPNSKYVKPSKDITAKDEISTFYKDYWVGRVQEDDYEVTRIWCKRDDSYKVICNGVLLLSTPIPFKHKRYPFAATIFEPFASDFFWGNSLIHKMAGDSEMYTTLINMMLDQEKLSINRPLINSSLTEMENNILAPGVVIDNPGGTPEQIREIQISSPSDSHFRMIETLSRNQDLSSVSSLQQGVEGSGSTAREIVIAEDNARKMLGIFEFFLENFVLDKSELRMANILQFYTEPYNKGGKMIMREFQFNDVELPTKKIGKKIIRIKQDGEVSTNEDLERESGVIEKATGVPTRIIEMSNDYIRDLEYELQIVPETLYRENRSLRMALELEWQKYVSVLYPEIFGQNKMRFFKDAAELYNKNPSDYLKDVEMSDTMPMEEGASGGVPELSTAMRNSERINKMTQTQTPSIGRMQQENF